MKEWQPLSQTELKDILPDDTPPPIPDELPPPFPTTYKNVQEERVEETIPPQLDISKDDRIKLLYNAKARIWAHWLFWFFIPYIGGIISIAKVKNDNDKDNKRFGHLIVLLISPIVMVVFPQIFSWWWFYLINFYNMCMGASKTQVIIEKARNKLNITYPCLLYTSDAADD